MNLASVAQIITSEMASKSAGLCSTWNRDKEIAMNYDPTSQTLIFTSYSSIAIFLMMEDKPIPKKVLWVGSARKDLKKFPKPVQSEIGQTLWEVQMGQMPPSVKLLKGFSDGPVMEIIEDYDGDTYRAVFTARFVDAIYILHCFQKKSKRGAKTPEPDKELIRNRLNEVNKSHRKEKL